MRILGLFCGVGDCVIKKDIDGNGRIRKDTDV